MTRKRVKIIKILCFFLAVLLGLLIAEMGHAKTIRFQTSAGIQIVIDPSKIIAPYEQRWGLSWTGIDWEPLDAFFLAYQEYYQSWDLTPDMLSVKIQPFVQCKGKPGYKMRTPRGCVEGIWPYPPGNSPIWIHLGDDSGQGTNSWCGTALSEEITHWFLYHIGSECWGDHYGMNPEAWDKRCGEWWPSPQELKLCR